MITEILEYLFPSLASGTVAGLIIYFLLKNVISERIKNSIKHEYDKKLEDVKKEKNVISAHETKILIDYVDKYLELTDEINSITHDYHSTVSMMMFEYQENLKKGKSTEQANEIANRKIDKPSKEIIEKAMNLKRHYVFLPSPVIEKLQAYEGLIFNVLRLRHFNLLNQVEDSREILIKTMRTSTADLISGNKSLGEILREIPSGGFTPQYMRDLISNKPDSLEQRKI